MRMAKTVKPLWGFAIGLSCMSAFPAAAQDAPDCAFIATIAEKVMSFRLAGGSKDVVAMMVDSSVPASDPVRPLSLTLVDRAFAEPVADFADPGARGKIASDFAAEMSRMCAEGATNTKTDDAAKSRNAVSTKGAVPAVFRGLWAAGRTCANAIEITDAEYLGPQNVNLVYVEVTDRDQIVFTAPNGTTGRKLDLWQGDTPETDRLIHSESLVSGSWMDVTQTTEYRRCASRSGAPVSAPAQSPRAAALEPPSDMAEGYCYSFLPIVEQALLYRQQGTPIAVVQELADGAIDVDPNLYRFLLHAIQFAYADPESTQRFMDDGRMLEACAQQVRGF